MATQNAIELVIRARNEAGPAMEKFGGGLREQTQAAQAMSNVLLNTLNPAMAQAVQVIGFAAREAKQYSLAMGGVVVGAAAVGLALGSMALAAKESAARFTELSIAVRTFDTSVPLSQFRQLRQGIEELETLSSGGTMARIVAFFEKVRIGWGVILGGKAPIDAMVEARNAFEAAAVHPRARETATGEALFQGATAARAQFLQGVALERGRADVYAAAGQMLTDAIQAQAAAAITEAREAMLTRIAQGPKTMGEREAAQRAFADREQVIRSAESLQLGQTSEAARLGRLELFHQRIGIRHGAQAAAEAAFAADVGVGGPSSLRLEDVNAAIEAKRAELGLVEGSGSRALAGARARADLLRRTGEEAGYAADVGAGGALGIEAITLTRGTKLRNLASAVEVANARAGAYGLSRGETLGLGLGAIEAQRRQAIGAAEGRGPQEDAANVIAEIQARALSLRHTEATDLASGLSRGLTDVVDEFEATGLRMQAMARNTADAMSRGFSEQFFAVITGDFKALPEIGKTFAQNMVRAITDELGKMVAAPILRQLREALGGATALSAAGMTGIAGTIAIPGVAGAVPLVGGGAALAGQSYQIVTSAGGEAVAVPIDMAIAAQASSGTLANLSSTIGAYLNTPIFYTSTGSVSAETASAIAAQRAGEIGTEANNLGGSLAMGSQQAGMTLGQAAGIVGSAAAFGFSVYGAYKTGDPYGGAISGGLTGAMFGTQIYPGIGTVVGLVAGAAIGAGAGILGKNAKKTAGPRAGVRSAQQAVASASAFQQALGQAQTTSDLLRVLNTRWSPYRELPIWAKRSDGSVIYPLEWIGDATGGGPATHGTWPGAGGLFTYEDLFDPSVLDSIEVQSGQSGAAARNEQLTQAVKSKITEIAGREGALRFGYSESLAAGAIQRETFLPISQLKQAAGQQGLFVSTGIFKAAGYDDNGIETLIEEIRRVSGDRDIDLVPRERFA